MKIAFTMYLHKLQMPDMDDHVPREPQVTFRLGPHNGGGRFIKMPVSKKHLQALGPHIGKAMTVTFEVEEPEDR